MPERRTMTFDNWRVPTPAESSPISVVSPSTALQKVAIWSCISLTAAIAETLPLDTFVDDGVRSSKRPTPGWLLDLGGEGYGTPDWCSQAVWSLMTRGNIVGNVLDRDARTGQPRLLPLYPAELVAARRDPVSGAVEWRVHGQVRDPSTLWHRRAYPVPGAVLGLSPIEQHMLTIGTGLGALRFGNQWFRDGAHPTGILSTPQKIDPVQAREAKQRFMAGLRGNREPVALGSGWEYKPVQVSPNESQFLETHRFTAAECCRIYGPAYAEVLGYETGGSMTYANVEQRSLDLLKYAVNPWLTRLERWISSLLPQPQSVKFDRDDLLSTDLLTRYRAHAIGVAAHFLHPDEAREEEDLPPLTDAQKADLLAMNVQAAQDPLGKGTTSIH